MHTADTKIDYLTSEDSLYIESTAWQFPITVWCTLCLGMLTLLTCSRCRDTGGRCTSMSIQIKTAPSSFFTDRDLHKSTATLLGSIPLTQHDQADNDRQTYMHRVLSGSCNAVIL